MLAKLTRWKELFRGLPLRTESVEHELAFLKAENIRLNELLRELIYRNHLERGDRDTRDSFNWQWAHLPGGEAMPENPEFLASIPSQLQQFCNRPAEWFRGKRVLDVGCGIGRWSHGLLSMGADVTSFDQSPAAIAATRQLCNAFPAHRVVQGDILIDSDLPPGPYDLVFCFGVCHHTADMLKAMEHVLRRVGRGGLAFLMLYGYPVSVADYRSHAFFANWRLKLAPLSFEERVKAIRDAFPDTDLHGNFDALSPPINELVTWEWIQTFMRAQGFTDVTRTVQHGNHHFIATRAV